MHRLGARRFGCAAGLGLAAFVFDVSATARAHGPVERDETLWLDAEIETPIVLGAVDGCLDLTLRSAVGAAANRLELRVVDRRGHAWSDAHAGVGEVRAGVCTTESTELVAIVRAGRDAPARLRVGRADGAVLPPSAVDATPDEEVRALGPGASFTSHRRLAARIEADERRGYRLTGGVRALQLTEGESASIEVVSVTRCVWLLLEADEGELAIEGLGRLAAGEGVRARVCPEAVPSATSVRVPVVASAGPFVGHAAVMVPTDEAAAGPDEPVRAPHAFGQRLARIVATGEATVVPHRLARGTCASFRLVGGGARTLVVTDSEGRMMGRAGRGPASPEVHLCASEDRAIRVHALVDRGRGDASLFVRVLEVP